MPPEAQPRQNVKIAGWTDNYYNIGPASYVFLKTTDLANRSYRGFIVSSQENVDVISRTKNVTNIFYDKNGVIDNGPDYDRLTQDSNVKIDRYKLNFVQQNNPGTQLFNQEAPSDTDEQNGTPQRDNEAVRRLRNTDEAPGAKGERQPEGDQNSENSKEKPADNKRSDQPEKQKVEPSGQ